MNLTQTARYKAYALALAHLQDNESITKDVPAIAEARQEGKLLLESIEAADNQRQQNNGAITTGKWQYRDEMAHLALTISSAIVSYAAGKNNQQLQQAMSFTQTELYSGRDREFGAKAANILAQAKSLASELKAQGITDEQLNSYATMVSEYLTATSAPRKSVAERKQAGQQIKDGLNALRDLLKYRLDKLMLQYKYSHPDFYLQYFNKRMVVDPAQRKTQVSGMVTDATTQAGLGNVQVLLQGTELVTSTQADGSYTLNTPLVTAGTLLYQKEGYATTTAQVEVRRGLTTRLDIAIKPM